VNKAEIYVKDILKKEGWSVMHKGYPDFFCYKIIDNKLCIQFIEVKSGNDRLTVDQRKMKEILTKCGLTVFVYCIDEKAIKSVNFACSRCGRNIPNNTKYCEECRIEIHKEQARESARNKRKKGDYDLYSDERTAPEKQLYQNWFIDKETQCECSKQPQSIIYDFKAGDAICKHCGLIIGRLFLGC